MRDCITKTVKLFDVTKEDAQDAIDHMDAIYDVYQLPEETRYVLWELHRSRKGVVLTTSQFSREAKDYIERIEGKKVVLIDGEELTQLMIDYHVGVATTQSYELLDISQDFFDEDF